VYTYYCTRLKTKNDDTIGDFGASSPTVTTPPGFSMYNNQIYGVSMQYPSNWTCNDKFRCNMHSVDSFKNHTFIQPNPRNEFYVVFGSPQTNQKGHNMAEVRLAYQNIPSGLNMTDYLKHTLNINYRNNTRYQDFQLYADYANPDFGFNERLSGQPSYKLVGSYTSSYGIRVYVADTGLLTSTGLLSVQALIDEDQFYNYESIIQKMIDSFTIT
jgi:hypothetical protein